MTHDKRLSVSLLKGKHVGRTIYVLATGKSAEFVDPSFLENKIAIGVNEAWLKFGRYLTYNIRKESERSIDAYASGIPLIMSNHNCGVLAGSLNEIVGATTPYYIFEHDDNTILNPNYDVINPESDLIVVSYSTITSALHVAAYMGAQDIIIIGHDCGSINGETRLTGLPSALGGEDFHWRFLGDIEPQTVEVRERIQREFNCFVYSLNPWLNFGLEGNVYEHA